MLVYRWTSDILVCWTSDILVSMRMQTQQRAEILVAALGQTQLRADDSLSVLAQTQQSLERDLRHMESTLQGMLAQGNPLANHYQGQITLVKQRIEQMGDMYIGYTAAISVSPQPPLKICSLERGEALASICVT